jgi:hypothetical protein
MFSLQPPRHISTLPTASVGPSWHVGFTPDSGRIAARQRTDASAHKATSPFRTIRHQRWATNRGTSCPSKKARRTSAAASANFEYISSVGQPRWEVRTTFGNLVRQTSARRSVERGRTCPIRMPPGGRGSASNTSKPGARDCFAGESMTQRGLFDDRTACRVDEVSGRSHEVVNTIGIEDVAAFARLRKWPLGNERP